MKAIRFYALVLLSLAGFSASAATYYLPTHVGQYGTPFYNCYMNGSSNVVCNNTVTIYSNDEVRLTKNLTLYVGNNLQIYQDARFNTSSTKTLTLTVWNYLDMRSRAQLNVNDVFSYNTSVGTDAILTAANIDVSNQLYLDDRARSTGNIEAYRLFMRPDSVVNAGNVDITNDVYVSDRGVINANLEAYVAEFRANSRLTGTTVDVDTDLRIRNGAQINATVTANKVFVHNNSEVNGNVTASNRVETKNQAVINGNVVSSGQVKMDNNSRITGNVTASGNIELKAQARIVGTVVTSGKIELKNSSSVQGNVTASSEVKIHSNATITGLTTTNKFDSSGTNNGDVESKTFKNRGTVDGTINASTSFDNNNGTITGDANVICAQNGGNCNKEGTVQGQVCYNNPHFPGIQDCGNQPPHSLSLSNNSISTDVAIANATIGSLSATDPENQGVVFALATCNGASNQNSYFAISGSNTLKISPSFIGNITAGDYDVCVQATDQHPTNPLSAKQTFTVTVTPSLIDQAFARYRFEESSFNSGIADSSSNGFTGYAVGNTNSVLPSNPPACRAADIGNNYSRYVQDAFNTNVTPNQIGRQGTIAFWFKPDDDWGDRDLQLFDADRLYAYTYPELGTSANFKARLYSGGRVGFHIEDVNGYDRSYITQQSFNFNGGDWVYLAFTWDYDTGALNIFVDGGQSGGTSFQPLYTHSYHDNVNLGSMPTFNSIYVGDNRVSMSGDNTHSNTSMNGVIDEVVIFDKVLTTSEISSVRSSSSACEAQLHHYEIIHDGSGLTCATEPVTIKACGDANCTNAQLYQGTVNFGFTPISGATWTPSPGTFSGGQKTYNLKYTEEGTVAIGLQNASPSAANPVVCKVNGSVSNSCELAFSSQGFQILKTAAGAPIDTQVAEQSFNVVIKALMDDGTNQTCVSNINGSTSLEFTQSCHHSGSCLSNKLTLNNTAITATSGQYTSVPNITFNANGEATISAVYNETGTISIGVRHDINGDNAAPYAFGTSNQFDVIPDKLLLRASADSNHTQPLNSADANGTAKHIAGKDFSVEISALGKAGGTLTQYQPGDLDIKLNLLLPSGGANGSFVLNSETFVLNNTYQNTSITSANFAGGIFNELASYSEVGVITAQIKDADYLDPNNTSTTNHVIESDVLTIGRFQPAAFKVLDESLNVSSNPYSYLGNALDVIGDTKLTLRAVNLQDQTTFNYDTAGFFKHQPDDSDNIFLERTYTSANHDMFNPDVDDKKGKFALVNDDGASTFLNGNGKFTYVMTDSNHDSFGFVKTTEVVAPFNVQFDLNFSTNDLMADGIGYTEDTAGGVYTGYSLPVDLGSEPSSPKIRYGRLNLLDGFGAENQSLNLDFVIEYCNQASGGVCTQWVTNVDDFTTQYSSSDVTVSPSGDATAIGDGTAACGVPYSSNCSVNRSDNFISLTSTDGLQRTVEVSLDVPLWLQFDWDGSCTDPDASPLPNTCTIENPSANMTFGIFRGNDRIINWQEL